AMRMPKGCRVLVFHELLPFLCQPRILIEIAINPALPQLPEQRSCKHVVGPDGPDDGEVCQLVQQGRFFHETIPRLQRLRPIKIATGDSCARYKYFECFA